MPDPTALREKVLSLLLHAADLYRSSASLKVFAAKQLPQLNEQQVQMRLTVLRMGGQLAETEVDSTLDALCEAWLEYRKSA